MKKPLLLALALLAGTPVLAAAQPFPPGPPGPPGFYPPGPPPPRWEREEWRRRAEWRERRREDWRRRHCFLDRFGREICR